MTTKCRQVIRSPLTLSVVQSPIDADYTEIASAVTGDQVMNIGYHDAAIFDLYGYSSDGTWDNNGTLTPSAFVFPTTGSREVHRLHWSQSQQIDVRLAGAVGDNDNDFTNVEIDTDHTYVRATRTTYSTASGHDTWTITESANPLTAVDSDVSVNWNV